MHHVYVVVSMRVMAVPAELAAIVRGTMLGAVVQGVDLLRAVLEHSIDRHSGGASGMTTLAGAVFAPGCIRYIPESEGVCVCMVTHGAVVAERAGICQW